jgi:hypothetical protein
LDATYLQSLDRSRVVLDTAKAQRLALRPLEANVASALSAMQPTSLGYSGAPRCELAVVDMNGPAIRLLDSRFNLIRSIALASIQGEFLPPYRVAIGSDGTIALSEGGSGRVAILSRNATSWRVVQAPHPVPENRHGSALAVSERGEILDHWFASGTTFKSTAWSADLPLMRVLDSSGSIVRQLGRLVRYPGESFTPALNRGVPVVDRDTIFFLRRADSRILVFPLASAAASPTRSIDLPVAFEMSAPRELQRSPRNPVWNQTDFHATSLAIDPSGRIYVGHVFSHHVIGRDGRVTSGGIGVHDRNGRLIGLYRVDGALNSMVATNTSIAGLVSDTTHRNLRLQVFISPFSTSPSQVSIHTSVSEGGTPRCE